VTPLVHKDMRSVSTPTHTTFSEKTNKQQALVLTVYLKECAVHSEKT
jgi:hypothetical protein